MKQRNVKLILLSSRGSINPHTNKKIKCSVWPPPAVLCKHPAIQHCGFGSCHIVPIKSHLTLLLISLWLPSLPEQERSVGFLTARAWIEDRSSVLILFDSEVPLASHVIQKTKYKRSTDRRKGSNCEFFSTEKVHFLAFLILFVSPLFCPIPS